MEFWVGKTTPPHEGTVIIINEHGIPTNFYFDDYGVYAFHVLSDYEKEIKNIGEYDLIHQLGHDAKTLYFADKIYILDSLKELDQELKQKRGKL